MSDLDAAGIARAAHAGRLDELRAAVVAADPAVAAQALTALARAGALDPDGWAAAATSSHRTLRLAAAEAAARTDAAIEPAAIAPLLDDDDPLVVEAACFAVGERGWPGAVAALRTGLDHDDARVRESAVAALGSLGAPDGIEGVLQALDDKPAIRRRAVIALAAFDDDRVPEAWRAALDDRDWQVREAAATLLEIDQPDLQEEVPEQLEGLQTPPGAEDDRLEG